jgi:hypothetical protein
MKTNPLIKYYERLGTTDTFDEWLAKYKQVYASRKREISFEDWIKIIVQRQHEKSNNEMKKLSASGDINVEALRIDKRYMGIPLKVALPLLIIAFGVSVYIYVQYNKKHK